MKATIITIGDEILIGQIVDTNSASIARHLNAAGIVVAGIVIVCFYNGRRAARGKTFLKWFFYLFYPVHMLILGLLRIALIG